MNSYHLQVSYRIGKHAFDYPITLEAVSVVHACATVTVAVLGYFQNVTEFKAEEISK